MTRCRTVNDYSALRGPCPEGYHIGTKTERDSISAIMTALGMRSDRGMADGLFMPRAGTLSGNTGNRSDTSQAAYWTATGDNPYNATSSRYVYWNTRNIGIGTAPRADGYLIRPLKDDTVIPDSNRTVVTQGTGDAGIYHNSSLGLISISSDGENWITLADKNLGATEVYNRMAAVRSEANCGKFFQWGNNYAFPYAGPSSTSSTQVDASTYGPGNFYESSTFVLSGTGRDTSNNDDLRGGETGMVERQVCEKFTLHGAIQTFHWKRPYKWKPGANTLLYMPLDGDALDYSGNENNGTWSGTTEYKTIGDKQYAYINTNSCINLTSSPIGTGNPDDFTFSCWVRINENSYGAQPVYLGSDSTNNRFCLILNYYWVNRNNFQHINDIYVNTIYLGPTTSTPEHKGEWINVIYTYEKATQTSTLYINNSQTGTDNGYPINIASGGNYRIARPLSDSNFANYGLSEIIFENGIWSEEDRTNYYNRSKVNYEPKPREPNANTLAYFPFKSDSLDHSGNGKTLTNSGTKTTIGYNFSDSSEISGGISNEILFAGCWIKVNSASGTGASAVILCLNPNMAYYPYASTYLNNKIYVCYDSSYNYQSANGPSDINTWHYICFGYDGSKTIYGIDGVVNTLYNGKGYNRGTNIYLLLKDSGITCSFNLSDVIFEKRCRTAEEIANYYNQTKSNYGL